MHKAMYKDRARFSTFFVMLLGALALSACVTIHIYFPAAAAEKVADRIIDDIWQLPATGQKTPQESQNPAVQGENHRPQDGEGKEQ
jgi:hypothetical protein